MSLALSFQWPNDPLCVRPCAFGNRDTKAEYMGSVNCCLGDGCVESILS